MHDHRRIARNHQRIGCSPVTELLQKLVEDTVVALYDRVDCGE